MIQIVMFRSLWQYRGFVWGSVLREFNGKYRESLFGALWAVAGPLTMIVIYTVIFAQLMRPTLPGHESTPFAFSIYLCAGVITWGLFAEMLGRLNSVFLENGNLIKKANFPRICLPTIVILSALINFGILLGIYLLFLAIIGHWPGWSILAAIPSAGPTASFYHGFWRGIGHSQRLFPRRRPNHRRRVAVLVLAHADRLYPASPA